MKRNIQERSVYAALSIAVAVVVSCHADTCTDEELRHDVLEFLTTRCCGRVEARRVLTNEIRFDGNTNRLAGVLAEFAQTNDAQIAEWAMWQLKKYGTSEQLPFLYSCATNPVIGDIAVKSIINIEGVTSNSVDIAHRYLMSTNIFPRAKQHDRALICEELLKSVYESPDLSSFRPLCLSNALDFAQNVNTMHISLNDAIIAADPTYQYSKRRLAVMRTAQNRCVNQGLYNYVTNAINELVDYPEADLPD